MPSIKLRGYQAERKVRLMFDKYGWKTVRSGASLGEADLICIKDGKCLLIQVKTTKKKKFYYYDYSKPMLEKIPFRLVVDFGYGKIRIMKPQKIVVPDDGEDLASFLRNGRNK